jgi:hypothetical protein
MFKSSRTWNKKTYFASFPELQRLYYAAAIGCNKNRLKWTITMFPAAATCVAAVRRAAIAAVADAAKKKERGNSPLLFSYKSGFS